RSIAFALNRADSRAFQISERFGQYRIALSLFCNIDVGFDATAFESSSVDGAEVYYRDLEPPSGVFLNDDHVLDDRVGECSQNFAGSSAADHSGSAFFLKNRREEFTTTEAAFVNQ